MKDTLIRTEVQALADYMTLKNYSVATRKSYSSALRQFLGWRLQQGYCADLSDLDHHQARQYILHRHHSGKRWQTINGDYSALLKYFRYVKKLHWDFDNIPRPRKERQLPRIVSTEAVQKIIDHAPNLKHQTFICLLYGTGLRLGEALNLKITHIDGPRKQLLVAAGKGAKDRYVDLPDCLLELLRHYYKMYRPLEYLFNGKQRTEPLASRSAQHLIKETCPKNKAPPNKKTYRPNCKENTPFSTGEAMPSSPEKGTKCSKMPELSA